jgi:Zn-dependent peptidase ImmA (M78 family)/transcriptional regulator with XRE-family HTH domain
MEIISGERIKQAREIRGLTQTELAGKVGVNQSAIARIENKNLFPSDDVLNKIIIQTGFPKSFFLNKSNVDFQLGSLLFRCKASITLKEKCEAIQYGRIIYEIYEKIRNNIPPFAVRLPKLEGSPEEGAKITRSVMGLSPDKPIGDLIRVFEKMGVLIFAIPKVFENKDAFSLWEGKGFDIPLIFISSGKPGDRLRFSLCHEVGHLVLHSKLAGNISKLEKEADRFAAEFLLPEQAMRNVIVPPVTLFSLATLKPIWGVSIQALMYRAKELELITDRQYKYLNMQISKRRWKKREPSNLDITVEKPRLFRKCAEQLYGNPINYKGFANAMALTQSFLKTIMNAYSSGLTNLEKDENVPSKLFDINKIKETQIFKIPSQDV